METLQEDMQEEQSSVMIGDGEGRGGAISNALRRYSNALRRLWYRLPVNRIAKENDHD